MTCRGSSTRTREKGADVVVIVRPEFAPSLRLVNGGEFCFAYHITIDNRGEVPVRLLSRRWLITDGDNKQRRVEGAGVVGEQPHLVAGARYEYTSFVDFSTPIGCMEGAYVMALDNGDTFEAAIGVFSLSVPKKSN